MNKPLTTHQIHIWDHPQSRIRFLETVLNGRDWHATVHADPSKNIQQGTQELGSIEQELIGKGFAVKHTNDEHGQPVLKIHCLGDTTGLLAGFHELNLVQGARRTLTNLNIPFGHAIKNTRDFLVNITENPAKALGGLYLFSDIFYALAEADGAVRKERESGAQAHNRFHHIVHHYSNLFQGKMDDKALMSLSGIAALVNSVILLAYAHDGKEERLHSLNRQMHAAIADGIDPLSPHVWEEPGQEHGIISTVTGVLKKHPIESASIAQVLGQVAQFAAGVQKYRAGSVRDGTLNMARAGFSGLSWCMLMTPNKTIEHKDPNPWSPTRWKQEFQDNPQRFAGVSSAIASVFGAVAGLKENRPWQTGAEFSYLLGDATMLFVNKSHYGAEGAAAQEALGKAAATFIQSAPLVFGVEAEKQFVASMGRYLAVRSVEENMSGQLSGIDAHTMEVAKAEMVEAMAPRISHAIFKELAGKNKKTEKIAHHVAQTLQLFPAEARDGIKQRIAAAVVTMPGVYLEEKELGSLIDMEQEKLAATPETDKLRKAPSMTTLSRRLSELVFSLPGLGSAENALKLYDAIMPSIQAGKQDIQLLDHAMTQQAAKDLGIPAHQIRSVQQSTPENVR